MVEENLYAIFFCCYLLIMTQHKIKGVKSHYLHNFLVFNVIVFESYVTQEGYSNQT